MKKYLLICISILVIALVYNLLNLYTGYYFSFNSKKEPELVFFCSDSEKIYKRTEEEYEEFQIKGVELNSVYPGHEFSEYAIKKEKYKEWFEQIAQMGANTIKAMNRFDATFYDALYEYNQNVNKPLYLIQAIEITEYEANNSDSIYGFKNKLIYETQIAVDVIHGNRYLISSEIFGSGLYHKDVSKWTLGYIISGIGKEETIAFTDNTDIRISKKGYDGTYFYTKDGASETECIIAEIMDELVKYETQKYKEQKLVSFEVDMLKDPIRYKENVNILLGKICYIDMNNIKTKESLKSGKVVSYALENGIEDFFEMMDEEEKNDKQDILANINLETESDGFLEFINKYYDAPVLASSFGYSTSRNRDRENKTQLTETAQGEKIIETYKEIQAAKLCGGIITAWQDNWSLSTWNIMYATDEENEIYWMNKQSFNQGYGLLSFEPGKERNICEVDGVLNEWNEKDLCSQNDEIKVYAKSDLENLYLMLSVTSGDIYIPLDVTPKSGTKSYASGDILFDREADFLIKIENDGKAEILVQEYYDPIRAMYEKNVTGILQYSDVPEKYSNKFVGIRALLKKKVDASIDISAMTPLQREIYRRYQIYTTGALTEGNGNPESDDYNSLADYCIGQDGIEIQIPWSLLNFSSPNELKIHDDYYENYGVEEIEISEIYCGIGTKEKNSINLGKIDLKPWKRDIEVHERLKKSYWMIKEFWNI